MEKIALVVSEYNPEITSIMAKVAKEHAKFLKAEILFQLNVPGTFDMPLAIKKLLKNKSIDGVVVLGAVIEGDTAHDELIAHTTAKKITDLSVEFEKPVSLGISGPRMTRADAIKRIESYAKRAVEACIKMIRNLKELG